MAVNINIATLDFLYSLHKFGMKFGLRNIRSLLRFVGNPHKKFQTIHIAGTNGKGSTSSMIAAIYTAAGYKVGLYTSPHLVKFNERIRINGTMIMDADVARYTKRLKPQIQKIKATFFETTTAMAFKFFADQKVDIAIIETGLGGRLDSTNVIHPLVSVITSIGKDHTAQLGNSFAKIAFEKAGIIKPKTPVVIGRMNDVAKRVIQKTAKQRNASVIDISNFYLPENIHLELEGEFQQYNALCAFMAAELCKDQFPISDSSYKKGFSSVSKLSGLRGRFETISKNPVIKIDVAHNPEGISALVVALKKINYKKLFVVFGVMKDKDYRLMLRMLQPLEPTIIATEPSVERSLKATEIKKFCAVLNIKCIKAANVNEAIQTGKKLTNTNDLLLVAGSNFLVGEALEVLEKIIK